MTETMNEMKTLKLSNQLSQLLKTQQLEDFFVDVIKIQHRSWSGVITPCRSSHDELSH